VLERRQDFVVFVGPILDATDRGSASN